MGGISLNALGWTGGRCSRSSDRYLITISGTFFSSFLEPSVLPFFAGFAIVAMIFFLQRFCIAWFAST